MVFGKGDQVAGQNDLFPGLFTTGTIPEDYLPRGMDNLGQMAFITRGTTKFLSMLHQRFKKSKNVDTREHKVHELSELDRTFRTIEDSPSPDILILNKEAAAQLQPNDILFAPEVFSKYDKATDKVVYSRVFSKEFTDCEQMLVLNVEQREDKTIVNVRRADYGKGKNDLQGLVVSLSNVDYGTDGVIKKDDLLIRGLPTFPEGSDAPRGFWKNPVIDNNFTQEFKYALEITKESEIEKTWIGKTPIEIYRLLKTRQATLDVERAFLFNRKGKKIDPLGRVQYTVGGVVEFIPKDDEHVHVWDAGKELNYKNMLDFISKIPEDGGGQVRDLFCGIDLYVDLKKSFYDEKYLRYDPEASKEFDIPIESIVGAGIKINVIPLYTLQEVGWGKRGLLLDFSVPSFVPTTHANWDMKVEKDIGQKGVQIYKEQWIGIKGLERRYAQYQHILDFSQLV